MRKVYVNVTTRIIMEINEGVDVSDIIAEMDYNFIPSEYDITDNGVEFIDTEITDFQITDSK